MLRFYLELSEAEIAAMLGISPGTVKSTTARGLAALARALKETYMTSQAQFTRTADRLKDAFGAAPDVMKASEATFGAPLRTS